MPETPERIELPSGDSLYYRPNGHTYWREAEGDKCSGRLTGISTIAKALDTNADPLITWGAKLEAQGICELLTGHNAAAVDEIIAGGGDTLHRELVAAKLDWRSVRDRRATEGTTIHEEVFAALGRGERPSLAAVDESLRGYGQAAFRFWLDHDPAPIAVEQVVYLPDLGVAGRFDLLAHIDGEPVLFDAKTSKAAYLSHHVQLAGYALGCEASGFVAPTRTAVVLLRPDGSYEVVDGCATTEDWLAAVSAHQASRRISKAQREAVAA